MKRIFINLNLLAAFVFCGWAMAADHTMPSVSADEALNRLKAGNERFANSKESTSKPVAARGNRAVAASVCHHRGLL